VVGAGGARRRTVSGRTVHGIGGAVALPQRPPLRPR
jgi:hypothetical protein